MIAESSSPSVASLPRSLPEVSTVPGEGQNAAETEEPGACVKQVAARHDVYPGLLFAWRRQVREGRLTRPRVPMFIPVETERPVSPAISPPPIPPTRAVAVGRIEIELGDGSRVRVDDGVSLVTLRRVISALRG